MRRTPHYALMAEETFKQCLADTARKVCNRAYQENFITSDNRLS